MPDFIDHIPGVGLGGIDPDLLSPIAGNPAIMGAIREAEARGRAGSGTGTGGAPAVDPNQWGKDLIAALNRQEHDLQQITLNLANHTAMTDMGGTGYSLSAEGTAGDTVAVALATTSMQAKGGSMVDVGMKAAQKALEVQKKIS